MGVGARAYAFMCYEGIHNGIKLRMLMNLFGYVLRYMYI